MDFDSVPNKPLKDQPSKRDLFLFKRKNVEVAEYVTAKSVANFDENSEEDSKE